MSDIFSTTILIGGCWFNYNFIGGSYFVNAIILIILLLFMVGKTAGKHQMFTSKESMIEYLNNDK